MVSQVPRCRVAHSHETYLNLVDPWAAVQRPVTPVICTEPLDRHGSQHKGFGEFLKFVRWPA